MANLTTNTLEAAITVTEYMTLIPDDDVWTGTNSDGTSATDTCQDWTNGSNSGVGMSGWGGSLTGWVDYGSLGCDNQQHLYCLQDGCTLTGKITDTNNRPIFDTPGNTLAVNAYSDPARNNLVTNTIATVVATDVASFSLDISGLEGQTLYFDSPNLFGSGGNLALPAGTSATGVMQCGAALNLINQS